MFLNFDNGHKVSSTIRAQIQTMRKRNYFNRVRGISSPQRAASCLQTSVALIHLRFSLHHLSLGGPLDRPEDAFNMPLYEAAAVGSDGNDVTPVVAPYLVTFTPNTALGWAANDSVDFRVHFASIPENTVLYTVSVKRSLDEDDITIGQIVSRSPILATPYGDETIFFNHMKKAWQP